MVFAPGGSNWKVITVFTATAVFTNFLDGYSGSYPNTAANTFQAV